MALFRFKQRNGRSLWRSHILWRSHVFWRGAGTGSTTFTNETKGTMGQSFSNKVVN